MLGGICESGLPWRRCAPTSPPAKRWRNCRTAILSASAMKNCSPAGRRSSCPRRWKHHFQIHRQQRARPIHHQGRERPHHPGGGRNSSRPTQRHRGAGHTRQRRRRNGQLFSSGCRTRNFQPGGGLYQRHARYHAPRLDEVWALLGAGKRTPPRACVGAYTVALKRVVGAKKLRGIFP